MAKFLSVAKTRWSFYECVEAKDIENSANYFETLYIHYQNRGKRIIELRKEVERLKDRIAQGIFCDNCKNKLTQVINEFHKQSPSNNSSKETEVKNG